MKHFTEYVDEINLNSKIKKKLAREILIIFSISLLILIFFLVSSGWNQIIEFRIDSSKKTVKSLQKEIKQLNDNIEFKAPLLNVVSEKNIDLKSKIESKEEELFNTRTKIRELPYQKNDLKLDKNQLIYIILIFYLIRISWFLISWSIYQLKD